MTSSQHPKVRTPNDKDLKINPGIGQSKGLSRFTGDEDIAGNSTEEGDVPNDTNPQGGVDPNHLGRTNR